MKATVAEVFTNSSTCKRSVVLHSSRVACGGTYDNRVVHSASLLQRVDNVGNGRSLLANGYVDTINRVASLEVALLIENGIDSNSRLTRLAVANDKLTLATANRNHRVNTLQASLQGLCYGLAVDNTRCFTVERHEVLLTFDALAPVNRIAQRVDNAAKHFVAYLNRGNLTCTLYALSLLDTFRRAEQHSAHVILFKVHGNTNDPVLKFDQFVLGHVGKSVNVGYTITN